jgi:mannose-6-phosphate isomerase-like protein (cupin superfamily)
MAVWAKNIEDETLENENFRTELWTGEYAQLTVMSIPPGEEIGLEVHPDVDQFIRIEEGEARVEAGPAEDDLSESYEVEDDWAVIIPAGTWHNVINIGSDDLKLYSLYSPPNHPKGTVHRDKAEADAAEAEEHGH